MAYESEATVARVYTIPVLPVLLQTDEYSRAFYESCEPWWTPEQIDELVDLRRRRKAALDHREGREPLTLVAVTHECSIRQLVGTPEIMRTQLDHLVELSTAPNVELRVFPFSAPPLFTTTCMYAYFEFSEELDRDFVHVETHAGFRSIETAATVARYRGYYNDLYEHSLNADATRALIRNVQAEYYA